MCAFMKMKEHPAQSVQQWVIDVFLIVLQQWSSMAQRIYQAVDTDPVLGSGTYSLLIWFFSWDLLTIGSLLNDVGLVH